MSIKRTLRALALTSFIAGASSITHADEQTPPAVIPELSCAEQAARDNVPANDIAKVCPTTPARGEVHAVMFELTYMLTPPYIITHAQTVGGFPSYGACRDALPRVMSIGQIDLDAGEQIQLECSTVRVDTPRSETPDTPTPDKQTPAQKSHT